MLSVWNNLPNSEPLLWITWPNWRSLLTSVFIKRTKNKNRKTVSYGTEVKTSDSLLYTWPVHARRLGSRQVYVISSSLQSTSRPLYGVRVTMEAESSLSSSGPFSGLCWSSLNRPWIMSLGRPLLSYWAGMSGKGGLPCKAHKCRGHSSNPDLSPGLVFPSSTPPQRCSRTTSPGS